MLLLSYIGHSGPLLSVKCHEAVSAGDQAEMHVALAAVEETESF